MSGSSGATDGAGVMSATMTAPVGGHAATGKGLGQSIRIGGAPGSPGRGSLATPSPAMRSGPTVQSATGGGPTDGALTATKTAQTGRRPESMRQFRREPCQGRRRGARVHRGKARPMLGERSAGLEPQRPASCGQRRRSVPPGKRPRRPGDLSPIRPRCSSGQAPRTAPRRRRRLQAGAGRPASSTPFPARRGPCSQRPGRTQPGKPGRQPVRLHRKRFASRCKDRRPQFKPSGHARTSTTNSNGGQAALSAFGRLGKAALSGQAGRRPGCGSRRVQ